MTTITELVLVTGMTGAGRSTAAKALEDLGFFVVDNLPPQLLGETLTILDRAEDTSRVAVVVDARSRQLFAALAGALESLKNDWVRPQVLFLEAADEVLVRRQEAARRPHPLRAGGRLMDAFVNERALLSSLRARADVVVDTTHLNVNQLNARVTSVFASADDGRLHVNVVSFGFKYGIPVDAEMVADVRFLPNPFWVPELRPLTGRDDPVREFVRSQDGAEQFLEQYENLLATVTTGFLRENKRFLSVAIGCTGGKHRSVAMSEGLAGRLEKRGLRTLVVHRDLGRE
ncbi:RNase adapter RapZ [Solicola sp. PLA-1-18]|uniref:RNase adapter RapZ n=1 Tax=Solicola sp. PLA-1-18 TaxID=3380532 RepID=UPI003B807566